MPVYLHPHEAPDLQLPGTLTGHIDILQIRGRRLWILDYKPDARRERFAKYQIYLYARALSVRTGLPLRRFALAYFDEKDYFEVSPSPAPSLAVPSFESGSSREGSPD
jgi:ATP-dependent exoDNAse (exonuclease V) beta subunit